MNGQLHACFGQVCQKQTGRDTRCLTCKLEKWGHTNSVPLALLAGPTEIVQADSQRLQARPATTRKMFVILGDNMIVLPGRIQIPFQTLLEIRHRLSGLQVKLDISGHP